MLDLQQLQMIISLSDDVAQVANGARERPKKWSQPIKARDQNRFIINLRQIKHAGQLSPKKASKLDETAKKLRALSIVRSIFVRH